MDDFKISPIRNGTAIDHIAVGQAINVLKILNVNEDTICSAISIGMHVKSKKNGGWKDIIKIEDRELDRRTMDKIALIAPDATISIIRDYAVAVKHRAVVADHICGIVKCSNPNCITNRGEPIKPEFDVISRDPLILRCSYCDRKLNEITENLIR